MASMEERASRLEDAFEQFSVVVHNMATKEELRASFESLRTEIQVSFEELRVEIRAAELRTTRWTVGSIFAASVIIIAAVKLLP